MELMPAVLLVAGLAAGAPAITYYALAGRYLGDLYPLMAVGTAIALPLVIERSRRDRWWARMIFPVVAVAAVAGCIILYQIRDSVF
jgi:hypothetical protein